MRALALAGLVLVVACGKQGELMPKPPPGETPHLDPTKPTPTQRLVIPTQAEPARVDDPLQRSEERRADRFDLPPQR